ncbi:MAG: hypothetical protein KDA65_04255 [Planctomycetaceae bacterium]|nr:hypothetical protein [Planctomycetaceae bacterium]
MPNQSNNSEKLQFSKTFDHYQTQCRVNDKSIPIRVHFVETPEELIPVQSGIQLILNHWENVWNSLVQKSNEELKRIKYINDDVVLSSSSFDVLSIDVYADEDGCYVSIIADAEGVLSEDECIDFTTTFDRSRERVEVSSVV